MAVRLGGGRRRGSRTSAGRASGCGLRCGCGCGSFPYPPTPSSHLGRPGGRWLAPWERYSPYHTPARLPGNWDGVVTPRRLEPGRCFPFLAAPSLSFEVVEGWHLVSLLRGTTPHTLAPLQPPAQRSPARPASGSLPGAQAALLSSLILGKSSSGELGTATGDQSTQGDPRKWGREGSKVNRLWTTLGWPQMGFGARFGPGFWLYTQVNYLSISQTSVSASDLPSALLICEPLHYFFTSFFFFILTHFSLNKCI